jgi:hypothetical protein
VIHGPTQEYIYRGMAVTTRWIKTALNLKKDDKLPDVGRKKATFTFKPFSGVTVTSWTTNEETAMQFANDADEDDYQIVMIAKVADNEGKLIACDDGLYKINGLNIKENETFAFENINVSMILWKRSDSDEDFQPLSDF